MTSAILLISCDDKPGLVAQITTFIHKHNGNILDLHQHVDKQASVFFMRVAWDLTDFKLTREEITKQFQTIAWQHRMTWRLHFSDEPQRVAIFVSKHAHCLYDILARWQSGDFAMQIPLIISNHPDMQTAADAFGIPYHHLPMNKQNKAEQEKKQLALLEENDIDLVILARYMQILSADFVDHYANRIINVHHSFLPAFPGARPYQQAYDRGVKIFGATSHYVTAQLDQGPIIAQDVTHADHRDAVKDLIRKGRDLENTVLARAVYNHLQHRVLVHGNKTVVFD